VRAWLPRPALWTCWTPAHAVSRDGASRRWRPKAAPRGPEEKTWRRRVMGASGRGGGAPTRRERGSVGAPVREPVGRSSRPRVARLLGRTCVARWRRSRSGIHEAGQ
jgi:hypothetical protein